MRYWPQKPPLGVPVNWGHPLARGLVGCWLMNEGSGNKVYDLSGNGNHGIITPGTGGWAGTLFGNGIRFDALNTKVNCGPCSDKVFTENGPLTIVAWANPATVGEGSLGAIAARALAGQTNPNFTIVSSNSLQFYVRGSTSLTRRSQLNLISLGMWQQFAMTWDGSTAAANVHIYVQGRESPTYFTTTDGSDLYDNSTASLIIGNNIDANRTFDGLIDHVLIWNRALTASGVLELYRNPFGMFEESF